MKNVAEVLGNASCVRILELLGEENLTISDISEKLRMKINTTDYNVKKLVKAGLIEGRDHWWSVKGKKMIIYRVSNKRIIISPRKNNAKKFLWGLGLIGIFGIWLRNLFGRHEIFASGDKLIQETAFKAAPEMKGLAVDVGTNDATVRTASDTFTNSKLNLIGANSNGFWTGLAGWEWFLIGAWTAIVLFFVFSLVSERRYR